MLRPVSELLIAACQEYMSQLSHQYHLVTSIDITDGTLATKYVMLFLWHLSVRKTISVDHEAFNICLSNCHASTSIATRHIVLV